MTSHDSLSKREARRRVTFFGPLPTCPNISITTASASTPCFLASRRGPPMFEVFEATTEEQKEHLYRFRYEVFVQEQCKYSSNADHSRRALKDALDDVAVHLCLSDRGQLIGSLRAIRGRQYATDEMRCHFGLEAFDCFPDEVFSFSGRLLLLPQHRGSRGLLALLHANYDGGRASDGVYDFLHCRPQLVKLYEQLGYRRYRQHFQHGELGYQIPMALVADDIHHLDRIRSPL